MNSNAQTSPESPRAALRAIRIFFIAIIIGAVAFALIVLGVNLVNKPESPFQGYENIIVGVILALTVLFYFIAHRGYNQGTALAKDSLISIQDKLNQYRTTLIKYLALCEAPALLGIILFFLSGNYFMLIATALMISAMLSKWPSRQRVIGDVGIDWQQQEDLNR